MRKFLNVLNLLLFFYHFSLVVLVIFVLRKKYNEFMVSITDLKKTKTKQNKNSKNKTRNKKIKINEQYICSDFMKVININANFLSFES